MLRLVIDSSGWQGGGWWVWWLGPPIIQPNLFLYFLFFISFHQKTTPCYRQPLVRVATARGWMVGFCGSASYNVQLISLFFVSYFFSSEGWQGGGKRLQVATSQGGKGWQEIIGGHQSGWQGGGWWVWWLGLLQRPVPLALPPATHLTSPKIKTLIATFFVFLMLLNNLGIQFLGALLERENKLQSIVGSYCLPLEE